MIRERISTAIRRRLPGGRSPEVDPTDLLAQLPTEDVISSGRLIANIRRNRLDQDLGFKAKNAWEALAEARKAQEREPDQDYSELIGQAQLQHGYAFAREIDADILRAKRNKRIKDVIWAVTIVGPVFEGVLALAGAIQDGADEYERRRQEEWNERVRAQQESYERNPEYWARQYGARTDQDNPQQ